MELFPSKLQSMRRFIQGILPFLLLALAVLLFLSAGNQTTSRTLAKEQQFLEEALTKAAVQTYALTGQYPETLDSLLETSGITYDPESFVVEYVVQGSNLLPSISVIPLFGGRKEKPYEF